MKPGDKLFYFTTCGWMMWNWLVSGLASGATLLLYDGSPMLGDGAILFDYAQAEGMTHFGTSAKFIDGIAKAGLRPGKPMICRPAGDVLDRQPAGAGRLRIRLSGDQGRPVPVVDLRRHRHRFVLRARQSDPAGVARRDPVQGLGMAVDVFDEIGVPVRGEKGELVCTRPFPVMPSASGTTGRQLPGGVFRALRQRLVPRRLLGDHPHDG
jgi:acetoacetyl-CoA synthetase